MSTLLNVLKMRNLKRHQICWTTNSLSGWTKESNQTYTERYMPLARGRNSSTVVFFIYLVR